MDQENNNAATEQSNSRKTLYYLVAILTIISIAYRLIYSYKFERSSILFVGLPALLTILVVKYSDTPKTGYGTIFKVITIFLLMSSILLGEGTICVIMAAPIFYSIGAIIVFVYDYFDNKNSDNFKILILLPLILILGQPSDYFTSPDNQTVTTSIKFDHELNVEMLKKRPDLSANLPFFFTLGFPKPLDLQGSGITLHDTLAIQFESKLKGQGKLIFSVVDTAKTSLTFKAVSDNSHIGQWIKWDRAKISIINSPDGKYEVIWTTDYKCTLGPGWYFKPWQRWAVKLMNQHLIRAYFG